jgi:iron uptake system EfeUOB component EfeO/EfeM
MRLDEIFKDTRNINVDIATDVKNQIFVVLRYLRTKKYFQSDDFKKVGTVTLNIIKKLRKSLVKDLNSLDSLIVFLEKKIRDADSLSVHDRVEKKTLVDILNILYIKAINMIDGQTGELSIIANTNREAKRKIQQLALIIGDKTESKYVSQYAKQIIKQTAALT